MQSLLKGFYKTTKNTLNLDGRLIDQLKSYQIN